MCSTLKEIWKYSCTPYNKKRIRGALTNGKLTGISVLKKINISFIVVFSVLVNNLVVILFQHDSYQSRFADSIDSLDFLSPSIPIGHCFWQVHLTASSVHTKWWMWVFAGQLTLVYLCAGVQRWMLLTSSLFSRHFIEVQVVQPYNITDTAIALKTSHFILVWWVKGFAIFWYMLVCVVFITWPKQFKLC